MLLRILSAGVLLVGCGGSPTVRCALVGDVSQPVQLQAIALDAAANAAPVAAGGAVLLQRPSQGGFVVYAGARARNLQPCNVQLAGELIDPASGLAVSERSSRGADLVDPQGGYWQPAHDALQFELPNIPTCRDLSGKGVVGRSLLLRVEVTDASGRHAVLDQPVIPACPAGDTGCQSSCGSQ